jgi:hypothetical protein
MTPRVLGLGVCLSAVIVLSLALIGCTDSGAAPADPQAPAAPAGATAPTVYTRANFKFMGGVDAPHCGPNDWVDPDKRTRKQVIKIGATMESPPQLQVPVPTCAYESTRGTLRFEIGTLKPGYWVEVDIAALPINNKTVKGPFKQEAITETNPSAGRCVFKASNKYCEFKIHNKKEVPQTSKFGYNVYLYEDGTGELIDALDPGIMVIENP